MRPPAPLLRFVALVCLLLSATAQLASAAPLKIVLVGDSTVTDHAGWGLGFRRFIGDDVELINTAQGGRSSKSFIDEGRWSKALALHGDVYLIQFGHNDQPGKGPERETDPASTFPANLRRFIDEVRAQGGQPILVTSLVRRNFDKDHPTRILSTLTPYADATKRVAAEAGVPVVDLHALSLAYCEQLGPERTASLNPAKPNGERDTTHLDADGSVVFAGLIVQTLRAHVPTVGAHLRATPRAALSVAAAPDAIVSADGSGTHRTVQAAINAAPADGKKPFVILIKPGTYRERVVIPADKPRLTLRGEETTGTVLTNDLNFNTVDATGKKLGARTSATLHISADNVTLENLTVVNETPREAKVQALALYVDADRARLLHCQFLGWQDTVRADKGRQYYRECRIEGHVDFIYAAGTAVFDRCQIHARADGYLTAASTEAEKPFGYVFLDCTITAAPEVTRTYLGRPWKPTAATAFLRCALPAQIDPAGWHNWGKPENEKTVRFAEYHNTGPGARPDRRVAWSRQLSDAEARGYTPAAILAGTDGWKP